MRRDEAAAAAPTTLSITAHANGTIFLSTGAYLLVESDNDSAFNICVIVSPIDSRFTNCQDRFDNTFFFVPVWTTLAPLFKLVPQFAQGWCGTYSELSVAVVFFLKHIM